MLASSFRDPSGFLFLHEGRLLRQVNSSYRQAYDVLNDSGLYTALVDQDLLVPHEEVDPALARSDEAYKILAPEIIPFISYPYEWCFGQLRDAALATLRIQQTALRHGMCLKDASAYNIQFRDGQPVLIDTLSFVSYREGEPWVAYRQFCQHFLAPLALMAYRDVRLGDLLRLYIDGIPLDLVSKLLPRRTRIVPSLLLHLHAHAASQKRYAGKAVHKSRGMSSRGMSARAMQGLIDNLHGAVKRLRWRPRGTTWADYYQDTNYTEAGLAHKRELIGNFLARRQPGTVWDLGANNGLFSRLASDEGFLTVSADSDPTAVELNYRECRQRQEKNLLPLVLDLTNPSPSLGWGHAERMSLLERGPADLVMALALVHHLAIANNVPLPLLAGFFRHAGRALIVEFVPKSDSQVQRLLATREDIFVNYNQEAFEAAFRQFFTIEAAERIRDSERTLYLMHGV